jgi:uncharacterized protein YlzI (FlbEa/FlbD family)
MNKHIIIILILSIIAGMSLYLCFFKQNKNLIFTKNKEDASATVDQPMTGTTLVTMNGKVIITTDSLQEEKKKLFKANPQFEKLGAYMDLDRKLLQGLTSQAVMDNYIENTGTKNSDAYQRDLQAAYKDVERMINTKYFSQAFPGTVSEADMRNFYEANKDLAPDLIIARGGIKATEVLFDQEAPAKAFADKVKAKNGDVNAAAKEANIDASKIKDLKLVHEQSIAIDQEIKDALKKMTRFPDTTVIKLGGNQYAVIVGTAKEETQYRPFEQIKDDLRAYLEKEKQTQAIEMAIETLKKDPDYNIVVDDSHFGPEKELPQMPFAGGDFEPELGEAEDELMLPQPA